MILKMLFFIYSKKKNLSLVMQHSVIGLKTIFFFFLSNLLYNLGIHKVKMEKIGCLDIF